MPEPRHLNGLDPITVGMPLSRPQSAPPRSPLGDFARRVVVVLLLGLLFAGLGYIFVRGFHVLLQTFAGILLALFLGTLAKWLSERTGLSYKGALLAVTLALLAAVAGMGWLLANHLAVQLAELADKLPQSLAQIRDYLNEFTWGRVLLEHAPATASSTLAEAGSLSRVTGVLSGVTNFLIAGVVVLFVGIFGAAEPALYRAGLLHLIPPAHRRRAGEAVDTVFYNLRWWLVGQVILMGVMWLTTTAGLWLIGVPLALTLGLIAGILELVPYVGPWLSAVPAALVALLLSPWHLAMVLGLYLCLHILEGYLLLPLIQRGVAELPPALTLVTQVVFGDLFGALGLFVAAPLTVVLVVLLKMLYVEDTLGDEEVEVPGEPDGAPQPQKR